MTNKKLTFAEGQLLLQGCSLTRLELIQRVTAVGGEVEEIQQEKNKVRSDWFKRGVNSVKRQNKSGCCCIVEDDDRVTSLCAMHNALLKEKDGEIENWARAMDEMTKLCKEVNDEKNSLKQKVEELRRKVEVISSLEEVGEQTIADLQATLGRIREVVKPILEQLDISGFAGPQVPDSAFVTFAFDDSLGSILRGKDLRTFQQACTEGMRPISDEESKAMRSYEKKHYTKIVEGEKVDFSPFRSGLLVEDSPHDNKLPPCPDCGGSHIQDRMDWGCGGPQKPPRPKGDNPHG